MSYVGLAGQPVDAADQFLAGLVGGVGLAGEHELHRPVGVEQERLEAVELLEQQRGALVGGEAAGESDREHVGIEQIVTEQVAHHLDELAPALVADVPDLRSVDVVDTGPFRRAGEVPVARRWSG